MNKKQRIESIVSEQLGGYIENQSLEEFNIIHLYDTGKLCAMANGKSRGYVDSRLFKAVIYNTNTNEKRTSHDGHDGLSWLGGSKIAFIRIFADGSTLIRLSEYGKAVLTQNILITKL